MNKVRYERDIDKIYDNMTMEKQGQLIDSINNILMNARCPVHLNENITDKELREFLYEYVRTNDEVFEDMVTYFELPYHFDENLLDYNAVIESNNDYDWFMENLHLNTYLIYENDFDDLIQNQILIEFKKE